jgi:beta-lactamase regulating signal transducer with metallopeptidase domain
MFTMLADAALKGFVLLAAIALLAIAMRRASAARQHMIWLLGVLGLLLLPLMSAALPAWRVDFLPEWLTAETEDPAAPPAIASPITINRSEQAPMTSAIPKADIAPVEPAVAPASPIAPLPDTVAATEPRRQSLITWLIWLWAAGALLAFLPTLAGLWQLAGLRRNSTPVRDESWLAMLDQVSAMLKLRRRVRLLCSPAAAMPLTFGAWRPVLLLPTEADTWPVERRRLVLLHELAHIRRADWLTQMAAQAACALHWFNPLAWLSGRQMQVLREQACDDLVLACGARASDYAEELLAIAARRHERPFLALAAVPMARRSGLESRLRAVLDSRRNRTSLTAATALAAILLLTAVLVPLAMLQAAGPKPHAEAKAASPTPQPGEAESPVVPRDPTPDELAARARGIRLSVLNAKGDQGIREFRVIAGVPARGIADEFERRTGKTVINWQPHTLELGKDGDFVWPLDKAYDEMALRVEADGFVPQVFYWLKKAAGPQHLVFMLAEEPGVKGRVLRPDGEPAVGATLALAMVQRDAVWEEGRIRGSDKRPPEKPADRWRLPVIRKTDGEGRFQLPTEPSPAAVLIVHESGVRELAYDEFQKTPEITLQPWGRIEGRVLWKDKPGANEPLSLIVHRDEYGYPGVIASYAKAQSDADGRFVFDQVLPGRVQISRPMRASATDPNAGAMNFDGLVQHVQVKAGEATTMVLGGQGRKVTGKLTGRDSWEGVTYHFHPEAPHIGFPGDDTAWTAFAEFRKSDFGGLFFRDKQPVNADGTFTIENMLPGAYQFFVSAPGASNYIASRKIQIEPEILGQEPAAIDLGEIPVKSPVAPRKAEAPAAGKALDGAAAPNADESRTALDEFLDRLRKGRRGAFSGNPIATNDQGQIVGLALSEFELKPGDARIIGQLSDLSWLSLQRSNVQDADLAQWGALKNLRAVNLWDAKISDAGIAEIISWSALQSLKLGGTGITDEALESVAKLAALRELDLSRTKVTDQGLGSLAPLKQLESLKLAETTITDAGLFVLDKLPALRGVTLDETEVTAAGLAQLAKRDGFRWMQTEQGVAEELARRMTAGDYPGVEAMLSIGLDLPRAGRFKTRSIVAHPADARDAQRMRKRFRIEWDWNNNGKQEGLFAEIAVRQASVRVMEAGVLEAEVKVKPKPDATTVTVRGKAVDDETGEPVSPIIVQAGKFDPADPTKVTWGFSESRSGATDGSFSATVRWAEGWTARILAAGYAPQPVLQAAPPAGKNEIEVVIRLKRGRLVRGRVLDSKGQPVQGAAVFAIGPTGLNLAGGKAWTSWGEPDPAPKPVLTDEAGRFELPAGEAQRLAVSCSLIDAWQSPIAEEGETAIRLTEAAHVEIQFDIEGAAKESEIFFQLLTDVTPGFNGLRCEHTRKITNGGKLILPALPPGKYQFCRQVMNRLSEVGIGAMLERQFVELKSGQTHTISFVRPKGARVRGKVISPPGVQLMGILVSIESETAKKGPFDNNEWTTTFASQTAGEDGSFLTERISPGTYVLKAEAYIPLTPEQRVRTGIIGPTYRAVAKIDVPDSGELVVPGLSLAPIR